jgi:phosphoribosylformylglycinamidine cyclo-ligase
MIAASTDGVGTKLKLAFRLGKHDTVGIDLVAMSVNDLLCVGSEPLFFLDYFATGRLDSGIAESVLKGIVEGCRQAGCALVGGETAEMPDFYADGEYDLGGFAVGLVNAREWLPSKKVAPGDAIIGIAASGCHSNGFSLLRKLVPDGRKGDELASELLTPTRIYCKSVLPLIKARAVKGLAHITGSGFLNVPRISEKVSYEITLPPATERPLIYEWVRERSGLPLQELAQTFNMGIGMVGVVPASKATEILKKLKKSGEKAWELGRVVKRRAKQPSEVHLTEGPQTVTMRY